MLLFFCILFYLIIKISLCFVLFFRKIINVYKSFVLVWYFLKYLERTFRNVLFLIPKDKDKLKKLRVSLNSHDSSAHHEPPLVGGLPKRGKQRPNFVSIPLNSGMAAWYPPM